MIYGNFGLNAGKLAWILGTSVLYPKGNKNYRNYRWGRDKDRKNTLPYIINLGCKKSELPKNVKILNYNSELASDKIYTFDKFLEINLPIPRYFKNLEDVNIFPILGRKNKSYQGRGITFYKDKEKINSHDFFVEYIKVKKEFRIHVFQEEIIGEMNKTFNDSNIIHTSNTGAKLIFSKIDHNCREEILKKSIEAVKCIDLDFGAVDIIVDQDDNFYFLEVNSDPGMANSIAFAYGFHIANKLKIDIDSEVLEFFKNLKVPESFVYNAAVN